MRIRQVSCIAQKGEKITPCGRSLSLTQSVSTTAVNVDSCAHLPKFFFSATGTLRFGLWMHYLHALLGRMCKCSLEEESYHCT